MGVKIINEQSKFILTQLQYTREPKTGQITRGFVTLQRNGSPNTELSVLNRDANRGPNEYDIKMLF
jgi:hypothetical protein